MSKPIMFSLYAAGSLVHSLKKMEFSEWGSLLIREFPDQETYLRFESDVKNREVILLASLNQPNAKLAPLVFAAATAKALGAKKVTLIAPYLAYMRQDKAFHPGEGVTSKYFAEMLSLYLDEIITVDPHLHRYHALSEVFPIAGKVLHANKAIAQWIQKHIEQPLIIGPDQESEQWASEIAKPLNAPYVILEKKRHGDREVSVSLPAVQAYKNHTPVLVDDIISTGKTMIAALEQLTLLHMKPAVCIGVHAVFAENAYQELQAAKPAQIVTCNTIEHPSNGIDLAGLFVSL